MTMKSKYYHRSRITEHKFQQVVKYFCADLTAEQIATFTHFNRNTINRILLLIRQRLVELSQLQHLQASGDVEVDESYFGAKRVKGKRGRGANGKTIVFGILKRGGNVYTEVIPNCSSAILQGVIRGKVDLDTVIHSDGWRSYNGLVDFGYRNT